MLSEPHGLHTACVSVHLCLPLTRNEKKVRKLRIDRMPAHVLHSHNSHVTTNAQTNGFKLKVKSPRCLRFHEDAWLVQ